MLHLGQVMVFQNLCSTALATSGCLRVYQLFVGVQVIAIRLRLQTKSSCMLIKHHRFGFRCIFDLHVSCLSCSWLKISNIKGNSNKEESQPIILYCSTLRVLQTVVFTTQLNETYKISGERWGPCFTLCLTEYLLDHSCVYNLQITHVMHIGLVNSC